MYHITRMVRVPPPGRSLSRRRAEMPTVAGSNSSRSACAPIRFGSIVSNFYAIVGRTVKLLTFTTAYFQANVVIPYLIVAPYFFLGKITLGQMTQTKAACSIRGRTRSAMNFPWPVSSRRLAARRTRSLRVEDGALDETDHIYDLKISPSRWIEPSTCSCGSPGHWQRMMK
jgi:hypothetical protein